MSGVAFKPGLQNRPDPESPWPTPPAPADTRVATPGPTRQSTDPAAAFMRQASMGQAGMRQAGMRQAGRPAYSGFPYSVFAPKPVPTEEVMRRIGRLRHCEADHWAEAVRAIRNEIVQQPENARAPLLTVLLQQIHRDLTRYESEMLQISFVDLGEAEWTKWPAQSPLTYIWQDIRALKSSEQSTPMAMVLRHGLLGEDGISLHERWQDIQALPQDRAELLRLLRGLAQGRIQRETPGDIALFWQDLLSVENLDFSAGQGQRPATDPILQIGQTIWQMPDAARQSVFQAMRLAETQPAHRDFNLNVMRLCARDCSTRPERLLVQACDLIEIAPGLHQAAFDTLLLCWAGIPDRRAETLAGLCHRIVLFDPARHASYSQHVLNFGRGAELTDDDWRVVVPAVKDILPGMRPPDRAVITRGLTGILRTIRDPLRKHLCDDLWRTIRNAGADSLHQQLLQEIADAGSAPQSEECDSEAYVHVDAGESAALPQVLPNGIGRNDLQQRLRDVLPEATKLAVIASAAMTKVTPVVGTALTVLTAVQIADQGCRTLYRVARLASGAFSALPQAAPNRGGGQGATAFQPGRPAAEAVAFAPDFSPSPRFSPPLRRPVHSHSMNAIASTSAIAESIIRPDGQPDDTPSPWFRR